MVQKEMGFSFRHTTSARVFTRDVKRLNALKAELQDRYPYNLTVPFLIMMLLDEREKRNSLTAGNGKGEV